MVGVLQTNPLMLQFSTGGFRDILNDVDGRGLQSSTFQLNLSRFWHKVHPNHPLIPLDPPYIRPK
jgi:hypothetical protein